MSRIFIMMAASVVLGGAAPPQTASPLRKPMPIEDFAELPRVQAPALSPDGRRYAAKIAIQGKQYFAIVPVEGTDPPRLLNAGAVGLNWWRWVNDEWVIVGIGQSLIVNGDDLYATRALGFNTVTGKIVQLAGRDAALGGDDIIWTARDGSPRVMIAYQKSMYVDKPDFWPQVDEIDLATGKRKQIVAGNTGVVSWYADGNGVVRIGVGRSEDGLSSRVLYRTTQQERFRVVDRAKGPDDTLTIPSAFLKEAGKAVTIEDDEGGFSALYELDLATLQRGRQLFASKGYDIEGLALDPSGFGYLGVAVHETQPGIHWTDPGMAEIQKTVAGLIKGARASIVSVSTDRSRAMVAVGGADTPGAYFVYDRTDNAMLQVAQNNRAIGMRRMHPVKTIRYKARDGLEIAAVLTTPRGGTGKLPLVVMPHGGPFARDSETWDWWPQFLADRGYLVIQPNYRGSSGYGTQFTKKGEGQWGLAMQDDLNDAVTALADLGLADPTRVCMVGASYGGYAAMRAAQRDGTKYRCAVSYAGVSDLNRMIQRSRGSLYGKARSGWLRTQAPDLKSVSPVNYPEQVSIPLLLVHGEQDDVVPIINSRTMAQKLKSAGKDVTYIVQPEADHHFSRTEDRLEFLKALEAFLAKHNPA